jgi:hypothetical protein
MWLSITNQRKKIPRWTQGLCGVALLMMAATGLVAEQPPALWQFEDGAQLIENILPARDEEQVVRQENNEKKSSQKIRKKEMLKKQDDRRLSLIPIPSENASESKLELRSERPEISLRPWQGIEDGLQPNETESRENHLEEAKRTQGGAHLILMGASSEIRFRTLKTQKSQQTQLIPAAVPPPDRPRSVRQAAHTSKDHAVASKLPITDADAIDDAEKRVVAAGYLKSAAPLLLPPQKRGALQMRIGATREETAWETVAGKATQRRADGTARTLGIRGPFGHRLFGGTHPHPAVGTNRGR